MQKINKICIEKFDNFAVANFIRIRNMFEDRTKKRTELGDLGEFGLIDVLTKGFNIYYNDYLRGDFVSIRTFDNYISLINGNNAEQCGMNGFCSNQFVVEGDGSVYPCDFYCTDEWLLGNI